jgi:hypothetical protein
MSRIMFLFIMMILCGVVSLCNYAFVDPPDIAAMVFYGLAELYFQSRYHHQIMLEEMNRLRKHVL